MENKKFCTSILQKIPMQPGSLPLKLALASTAAAGVTLSLVNQAIAASLFVGSFNTNSVLQFDAQTGAFIDTFVDSGSGGLQGPVGLTFGPENNELYVVSLFSEGTPPRQVLQYDGRSGAFIEPFTSAVPPLIFPQDLAFGSNGNLFVANTGLDTIAQYDGQTGAFIGNLFPADSSACDAPFSITADEEASVYFSCTLTNNVQRYDLTTGQVTLLGSASSENAAPGGLSLGPDGALYVANFAANTIDRYDLESGTVEVFIDQVESPVQPVFAPNGDLYVSSNPTQKVGQPVPGKVLRYDGQSGRLIDDEFIPSFAGGLDGAGWIAFTDEEVAKTPEPGVLLGLLVLGISGVAYRRHRSTD